MNRIARSFAAFSLAAAASTALAAEPALMTDGQMDDVTGAGVVDVLVTDALNDWSLNVELAVQTNVLANVNAAVTLIGTALASQGIVSQTQMTGSLQ